MHKVIYKGSNVSFVNKIVKQTPKEIECLCIKQYYKKFKTAENDPHVSNAQRVSQILSSGAPLGGKINFGNANANRKYKYDALNAIQVPVIAPLRNTF
jgi:hypothetical protein